MKIEMFEKIGEIEIVELRSAVENKAIAEIENARKAEEKKKEKDRRTKIVLNFITKEINRCAEKGYTDIEIRLNSQEELDFALSVENEIKNILTSFGYRVNDIHEYSQSWKKKSGTYGYWMIYWDRA